jgi:ribulose 1,5-bisphosphate carboxylase large subunit-like protein
MSDWRTRQAEKDAAWEKAWQDKMLSTKYVTNLDAPGLRQIKQDMEARDRGEQVMMVNSSPMGLGIWNLIITRRDITLWTKIGMKPHRHWKVSHVKKYWGIKGTGVNLMANFMALYYTLMPQHAVEDGQDQGWSLIFCDTN